MEKEKNIKNYSDMIISIGDLMHQFYNYKEEDFKSFTHEELIYCYDEVELVKEVSGEDIYTGAVLLVVDSKHKLKMYANPYAEILTEKPIENINDYKDMILNIDNFMQRFYNFPQNSFKECSHKDIQALLPDLIQTKNVTAKDILTGEKLLVKDKNGKVRSYENPLLSITLEQHLENIKNNETTEVIFVVDDDIDKALKEAFLKETVTEEQLNEMSTYELAESIKTLKKNHATKMARLVQKELYFRPDGKNGTKQKHKKLERIRKKERKEVNYD